MKILITVLSLTFTVSSYAETSCKVIGTAKDPYTLYLNDYNPYRPEGWVKELKKRISLLEAHIADAKKCKRFDLVKADQESMIDLKKDLAENDVPALEQNDSGRQNVKPSEIPPSYSKEQSGLTK